MRNTRSPIPRRNRFIVPLCEIVSTPVREHAKPDSEAKRIDRPAAKNAQIAG
jgi:hypothetical protein